MLVCAFHGCGKSTFFKNPPNGFIPMYPQTKHPPEDKLVVDSDSSYFAKDAFPSNYISALKDIESTFPITINFVSTHDAVRSALIENKMPYLLIYPSPEDKEHYLERYRNRGSSKFFIDFLDNMWDTFIASCVDDKHATVKLKLCRGGNISNISNLLTHLAIDDYKGILCHD